MGVTPPPLPWGPYYNDIVYISHLVQKLGEQIQSKRIQCPLMSFIDTSLKICKFSKFLKLKSAEYFYPMNVVNQICLDMVTLRGLKHKE